MIYEGLLVKYLEYLAAKGYAKGTIGWRASYLKTLFVYLIERSIFDIREVTPQLIESLKLYLRKEHRTRQGKPLAESTYESYLTAVTDFCRWLERNSEILMSPVLEHKTERAKKPKPLKLPKVLSEEEVLAILEASHINTPTGLRDRAMLELLYATGIRRMEIANLNVDDVLIDKQELRVNQGKGLKDRVVPIGEYACRFTEMYLRMVRPWLVGNGEEKALFLNSTKGERMTKQMVTEIIKRVVKRAGIKKRVTTHMFRHTMATHLLRNQADLRHIQAILGHSSIQSTEIYTHLTKEDLKKVMTKAHPHGKRS